MDDHDEDRDAFHVASTFARAIARGGDEALAGWSAAMGLAAPPTSLAWRGPPPRPGGWVATLPAANRAAISADGRRVYLASAHEITAHALPSGDKLWAVEQAGARGLAIHPEGDLFVVTNEHLHRYDPAGNLRRTSSWEKRKLAGPIAIHRAGRHLAAATDDHEVAVIDLEADRIVALLRAIEDEYADIEALACLEDRVRIATGSEIIDLLFSFGSAAPPEARWAIVENMTEDGTDDDTVEKALPLADGRLLVRSGYRFLSLCDGATGDELYKLAATGSPLAASADGRLCAVDERDRTNVLDIAARPAAASHIGEVLGLCALEDGRIVSTGAGSEDLLVTLEGERLLRVPEVCGLLVHCDAASAIVLADERLFRVDIESGEQHGLDHGHSLGPAPAWSDGRRHLLSYPSERLLIFKEERDARFLFAGHRDTIRALAVDAAGERAASGDEGGEVLVWDLVHGGERGSDRRWPDARAPVDRWSAGAPVVVAQWFEGGLAVGTADGRILIKASNGIERIVSTEGPRVVALRAAGSRLVAADASGRVRIWSRDGLAPMATLQAHDAAPTALAVDDDRIVSGAADGSLRVFAWSGEALGRWQARAAITALALRRGAIVYGDALGELGELVLHAP